MKTPAYLAGERVGLPGDATSQRWGVGVRWGVIHKVERNVIALVLDGGGVLPIKRGPKGFGLIRHGDWKQGKFTYQDPKGLEESKRCLREAVKQLKSLTRRESFLAGKLAGRAIKQDKWAEEDRKYDELAAAKKALPVLIKLVRAWNSVPESEQVPEQINDDELWAEAEAIAVSVTPDIFKDMKNDR